MVRFLLIKSLLVNFSLVIKHRVNFKTNHIIFSIKFGKHLIQGLANILDNLIAVSLCPAYWFIDDPVNHAERLQVAPGHRGEGLPAHHGGGMCASLG